MIRDHFYYNEYDGKLNEIKWYTILRYSYLICNKMIQYFAICGYNAKKGERRERQLYRPHTISKWMSYILLKYLSEIERIKELLISKGLIVDIKKDEILHILHTSNYFIAFYSVVPDGKNSLCCLVERIESQ